MKRMLLVTIALLAVVLCSQSADRRNFWVLNNTGRTITNFYISVHGSQNPWSSDVLGASTLSSSLGTMIFFYDSNTTCMYDFRVKYSDGTYQDYLRGRNLCQTHAVQFNSDTNDAY